MTALGFSLIGLSVILAAWLDWAQHRHYRRKYTGEELRRIIKKL